MLTGKYEHNSKSLEILKYCVMMYNTWMNNKTKNKLE